MSHTFIQNVCFALFRYSYINCPWASNQIRKVACCACAGNGGNVFPYHRLQRKPLVSDPGMHHGTCVTHVPWCMSASLTHGGGENIPGIPGACTAHTFTYLERDPWPDTKEPILWNVAKSVWTSTVQSAAIREPHAYEPWLHMHCKVISLHICKVEQIT